MIRAVVVDDEGPARDRLRTLLGEAGGVRVVGEAEDGVEALHTIAATRPDLVFLDIQMPGMNGLDVVRGLSPPRPHVIFCTAFDHYAIEAFEQNAIDYLLKPVNRTRLTRAIERVRREIDEDLREREVDAASRVQARLLPQVLPAMTGLDYAGASRPARGIGGDFYDFLSWGEGRLGLVVGDVSGKGLYAGLLMAGLQARLQALAPRLGASLAALTREVNQGLSASTEAAHYATLFLSVYDQATRTLTYVNAGHNPPLLFGSHPGAGAAVEPLAPNSMVIGMMPDATYEEKQRVLSPGDVLVAYTDGVVEALSETEEEFGEARLCAAVAANRGLDAAGLRDLLLRELDRFVGNAPRHDDATIVVARVL